MEVGSMAIRVSNAQHEVPKLSKLDGDSDKGKVIGVGRSGRTRMKAAIRGTINTLLARSVGSPYPSGADNQIWSKALFTPKPPQ